MNTDNSLLKGTSIGGGVLLPVIEFLGKINSTMDSGIKFLETNFWDSKPWRGESRNERVK
jgi:hypothetical protein